jgi:hypothetical protein
MDAGASVSEINRVHASQFVPLIFMAQKHKHPRGMTDGM